MTGLFLALLISGISVTSNIQPTQNINAQVVENFGKFNLEAFIRDKKATARDTTYEFQPVSKRNDQEIAVCDMFKNHIVIYLKYWNSMSDVQKELTIFHELGHCVLGKWHLEGHYAIMNSHADFKNHPDSEYPTIRTKLIDELFEGTK